MTVLIVLTAIISIPVLAYLLGEFINSHENKKVEKRIEELRIIKY